MLALIIILGKLGIDKLQEYKSARAYEDMQQMVNYGSDSKSTEAPKATQVPITVDDTESSEEKTVTVEVPKKNLDWSRLQGINKDIYAWIYIPGTKVDYPVLQSTSDDSYYLNHNIDGTKGYPGCIYTEMANSKDFSDFNTVIYGHNMKNGSMFHDLIKYEDEEFYRDHKTINFDTIYKGGQGVYQVVAAGYSQIYDKDSSKFKYYAYAGMTSEREYHEFVDGVKKLSCYDTGVVPEYGSQLITLSTCTNVSDEGRFFVVAVRTDK